MAKSQSQILNLNFNLELISIKQANFNQTSGKLDLKQQEILHNQIDLVLESNNFNLFKILLLTPGFDVNYLNKESGSSLLHRAAVMGDSNLINILLDMGADIDLESKSKSTALHYAVRAAERRIDNAKKHVLKNSDAEVQAAFFARLDINKAIIKTLLDRGANPYKRDKNFNSPIGEAYNSYPVIWKLFPKKSWYGFLLGW